MSETRSTRLQLLRRFFATIYENCESGALLGMPVSVRGNSICGPRAGALELSAGEHTGPMMQKLALHDHALLRQMIPLAWEFDGEPAAFMRGRYVRLEVAWPRELAETMVRLDQLGQCPGDRENRWTVGVNEHGARVTTSLKDSTSNWLIAGATGSGKTVAARNAALQLAKRKNRLVLCDGKRGESLRIAEHLHGVVGPVAAEMETVRNALGWVYNQMIQRYERMQRGESARGAIVVIFDEFQELTDDPVVAALMRKIVSLGRASNVHLLGATQQPTLTAFGNDDRSRTTTRRQMAGRIALQVTDYDASRVVVGGSTPRADRLLGNGDAYLLSNGTVHRVQGAYVDESDFEAAPTGEWLFGEWPQFDPAVIGQEPTAQGDSWDGIELAISILAAAQGNRGRPTLLELFDEYEHARPGTDRARRLLALGRSAWGILRDAPEIADYCRGITD